MEIHQNFVGGNVRAEKLDDNTFFIDNELRDTVQEWFYWAFCVEGAQGKTLKFVFPKDRLGYYGAAVSYDLENWSWSGNTDGESYFTYVFGENENKVYFAHSMLYHPNRFLSFAKKLGLTVSELCKSKKGESVPYVTFGTGERTILFTARHHACESTGNYVLEGAIEELYKNPIENTRVCCVPFTDYDGVMAGDQGKGRAPYDHNRDYDEEAEPIYPETAAIRRIVKDGLLYGIDFHSPWHKWGANDKIYIVEKRKEKSEEYRRFGLCLEDCVNENSMQYNVCDNYPPDVDWNLSTTKCLGCYMNDVGNARLAFSLETTYFGTPDNIFTGNKGIELGRCVVRALKKYNEDYAKISFTGDILCSKKMIEDTKGNFASCFADIKDTLKKTDYLVGNCETPVAGEELGYTNELYRFNTPESFLAELKDCGFSLLTLANNHALDRDNEGVLRTLENCKKYGFETIGAYACESERNRVFVKEIKGIKIAFINYTYGVNSFAHGNFLKDKYMVNMYQPEETLDGSVHLLNSNEEIEKDVKKLYGTKNETFERILAPYLERLKTDIQNAKKEADFVIMISHCGGQYNDETDAYTKYISDYIKSCGADVIVGHHPHIIQKSDFKDGYLTAYSIGNFIADNAGSLSAQSSKINPVYSALLNLYIKKDSDKVKMKAGFKILKTIPDENGVAKTVDAYDLYKKTQDAELYKDILYFANRFANTDKYKILESEYMI